MNIELNGKQREITIGCRTFIYVSQLIGLAKIAATTELVVTINGKQVGRDEFAFAPVKSADAVTITTAAPPR